MEPKEGAEGNEVAIDSGLNGLGSDKPNENVFDAADLSLEGARGAAGGASEGVEAVSEGRWPKVAEMGKVWLIWKFETSEEAPKEGATEKDVVKEKTESFASSFCFSKGAGWPKVGLVGKVEAISKEASSFPCSPNWNGASEGREAWKEKGLVSSILVCSSSCSFSSSCFGASPKVKLVGKDDLIPNENC